VGLTRSEYASVYGPTTGDRIRLADTNLLATVEADDNRPGSEPLMGMGKTVREGQLMPPDPNPPAAATTPAGAAH